MCTLENAASTTLWQEAASELDSYQVCRLLLEGLNPRRQKTITPILIM